MYGLVIFNSALSIGFVQMLALEIAPGRLLRWHLNTHCWQIISCTTLGYREMGGFFIEEKHLNKGMAFYNNIIA